MEQAVVIRERVSDVTVKRPGRADVLLHREIGSGPPGQPGVPGPPGNREGVVIERPVAQQIWLIPHNLHYYPQVTVVDGDDEVIFPNIQHLSTDLLQITHAYPATGRAFLS